jgi:hypothetical protein
MQSGNFPGSAQTETKERPPGYASELWNLSRGRKGSGRRRGKKRGAALFVVIAGN